VYSWRKVALAEPGGKCDSWCSECNGGRLCPLRPTSEGQTEGLALGECQGLATDRSGHWDFSKMSR
jgi:hypothetical protein